MSIHRSSTKRSKFTPSMTPFLHMIRQSKSILMLYSYRNKNCFPSYRKSVNFVLIIFVRLCIRLRNFNLSILFSTGHFYSGSDPMKCFQCKCFWRETFKQSLAIYQMVLKSSIDLSKGRV